MSEARHTPGPWGRADHDEWTVEADGGVPVCVVHDPGCFPCWEGPDGQLESECAANARLIAAAPALLAALQTMSQLWHAYVMPEHYDGHAAKAYQEALDAIRKATKGD